jgi:hypothetical protein
MDGNSFSSLISPSIIIRNDQWFVNIPIAGIYNRPLNSEKYMEYKTFNNFCLFRILCQSELPESARINSKYVSSIASSLWKNVPQDFKDTLQEYCDRVKEAKKQAKRRTIHFCKKSYDQNDYNKPYKRIRRNKTTLKSNEPSAESTEKLRKLRIPREELVNKYFQEEIKDFVFLHDE